MAAHIPAWATLPQRTGRLYLEEVPPPGFRTSEHPSECWCVDRKAGYLLGRNADAVDVAVDHKSASRVHACLAHGGAGDVHLLDLGSVHGDPPLSIGVLCGGARLGGGSAARTAGLWPQEMRRRWCGTGTEGDS